MNSERQQAYLNLINQLLTCTSGEEAQILKTHPELLDDGLVAAMLEEADRLREQAELNNANRLKDFARLLGKVDGDFLAGIALKAEADRVLKQGNQQYNISKYREALQSWEQALTIYQKIGDRQGEAFSLGNLGMAYKSLGQYHRAIEFHQQSLAIEREIGDRQGEATSLGNLGDAYFCLGQFQRAIEFQQQSLEISREIGDRRGEASSLGCLGTSYQLLGQYHRAIEFHQQSLKISRDIGDRQGEAFSLGSLGSSYGSLGQYHRAIEFLKQTLESAREIGYRTGEANCLSNLGKAYYLISNKLRMRYKSIPKILSFIVKKIFIPLENSGFEQAEIALRASIEIHENLRSELVNNDHKASILETQAYTYRDLQNVLVAQSKFDEALEISEMSRTRAFVELLQQTLLTNDLPANDTTDRLSIPKIQQIARDRNSTIVEYSIIDSDIIYIWVIQPNGNITHRAAHLEPLNQQNQTLK